MQTDRRGALNSRKIQAESKLSKQSPNLFKPYDIQNKSQNHYTKIIGIQIQK